MNVPECIKKKKKQKKQTKDKDKKESSREGKGGEEEEEEEEEEGEEEEEEKGVGVEEEEVDDDSALLLRPEDLRVSGATGHEATNDELSSLEEMQLNISIGLDNAAAAAGALGGEQQQQQQQQQQRYQPSWTKFNPRDGIASKQLSDGADMLGSVLSLLLSLQRSRALRFHKRLAVR